MGLREKVGGGSGEQGGGGGSLGKAADSTDTGQSGSTTTSEDTTVTVTTLNNFDNSDWDSNTLKPPKYTNYLGQQPAESIEEKKMIKYLLDTV